MKKFFSIPKFWSNLINPVLPDTGSAVIHHAVISGDVKAAIEVLNYEACDPNVITEIPAAVGSGKTAAEIRTNEAVKEAIKWNLSEMNKQYNEEPTCASEEAQMNLMWYVIRIRAIQNNDISNERFKPSYFSSFPKMGKHIYDFISTGNNWSRPEILRKQIYLLDACKKVTKYNLECFFRELLS